MNRCSSGDEAANFKRWLHRRNFYLGPDASGSVAATGVGAAGATRGGSPRGSAPHNNWHYDHHQDYGGYGPNRGRLVSRTELTDGSESFDGSVFDGSMSVDFFADDVSMHSYMHMGSVWGIELIPILFIYKFLLKST